MFWPSTYPLPEDFLISAITVAPHPDPHEIHFSDFWTRQPLTGKSPTGNIPTFQTNLTFGDLEITFHVSWNQLKATSTKFRFDPTKLGKPVIYANWTSDDLDMTVMLVRTSVHIHQVFFSNPRQLGKLHESRKFNHRWHLHFWWCSPGPTVVHFHHVSCNRSNLIFSLKIGKIEGSSRAATPTFESLERTSCTGFWIYRTERSELSGKVPFAL